MDRISRIITAIDSHTAGEPTRVVTAGIPCISGNTMREKKEWMIKNQDDLRKMLMWEPRGHGEMVGAIITEPTSKEADIGVIFMDAGGYLDMCGHGCMGVVTVLMETGMIEGRGGKQGEKGVVLDTPAGKVYCQAGTENGKVRYVTVKNVPSFFYTSLIVKIKGIRDIPVEVAYGGNFFALVNARSLNIKVEPDRIRELIDLGLEIRKKVNHTINITHPKAGEAGKVKLVEIFEETSSPRNVVVFGSGQVDRSPCGTGTCAKMASLYAHKKLEIGEFYKYRSIINTEFVGRIIGETRAGNYKAVIPEVTGTAYITGIQQFIIDENDPFKYGFKLLG